MSSNNNTVDIILKLQELGFATNYEYFYNEIEDLKKISSSFIIQENISFSNEDKKQDAIFLIHLMKENNSENLYLKKYDVCSLDSSKKSATFFFDSKFIPSAEQSYKFINNQNSKKMETQKTPEEQLLENLKYKGFESFQQQVKEKLDKTASGPFTITQNMAFNDKHADFTLDFNKSESGKIFFNKFETSITVKDEERKMSFYPSSQSITAKESINLLEGRAVKATFDKKLPENAPTGTRPEKIDCWAQLDFKEKTQNGFKIEKYTQNYGYNIEDSLSKMDIKEFKDPNYGEANKQQILKSLQRGNLQKVTLLENGAEKIVHLSANPKYKNLNKFDEQLNPIKNLQKKNNLGM